MEELWKNNKVLVNTLINAIDKRIEWTKIYPEVFLGITCKTLKNLCEVMVGHGYVSDNRINTQARSGDPESDFIRVRTINGQEIDAYNIRIEHSSDQIIRIDSLYPLNHHAVKLQSSTIKYNCHAYAWHITDAQINSYTALNNIILCWIEPNTRYGSGNDNIRKYWTNDYYVETQNPAEAVKVYYQNGDHSAIVVNDSTYISKWGDGPLMQHNPYDCPYASNATLKYYHHYEDPDPDPDPDPNPGSGFTNTASINWSEDVVSTGQRVRLNFDYAVEEDIPTVVVTIMNGNDHEIQSPNITLDQSGFSNGYLDVTFNITGVFYACITIKDSNDNVLVESVTDEIYVGF